VSSIEKKVRERNIILKLHGYPESPEEQESHLTGEKKELIEKGKTTMTPSTVVPYRVSLSRFVY
jgi:hypothetical protein